MIFVLDIILNLLLSIWVGCAISPAFGIFYFISYLIVTLLTLQKLEMLPKFKGLFFVIAKDFSSLLIAMFLNVILEKLMKLIPGLFKFSINNNKEEAEKLHSIGEHFNQPELIDSSQESLDTANRIIEFVGDIQTYNDFWGLSSIQFTILLWFIVRVVLFFARIVGNKK
jgi:hypothetical protein